MEDRTTYLPIAAVRARYGNCSDVTIWRWMRDERTNFPQPMKATNRRRLWKLAHLEAWEASRVQGGANASAA